MIRSIFPQNETLLRIWGRLRETKVLSKACSGYIGLMTSIPEGPFQTSAFLPSGMSRMLPQLCSLVSFTLVGISSCATIPRAVPSSFELRPNELVNATLGPYGSGGRGRTGSTSATSFVELQLNLCNSGLANCYADGDSISEGAELIYQTGQSYLAEAWPTDYTYSVFMPAFDKRTSAPYKCKNGFQYGSAVLGRVAASTWDGITAYGGPYQTHDSGNEQRIFVCAAAKGDHFACTTHLSASSKSVALTQCKALLFDAVPYLKSQSGSTARTVVAGDLNLKYDSGSAENVQTCVPNGWTRKGDGDVQHTMFTNDFKFGSTKKYGLTYTDHDGWLVKLTTS
ncbi:uncharacterized protein EI97DRAFT_433363 [Westerdykella ornata]|uniref:Endonuclease/exonuclease/phosphatase domain-containing protein n=1 Tax=Westerdykella ornata TaxID=318751 RepID=A0A6A6JJ99_WESOR|nr:uncharacterized protein EI97DRAFT_433363 [Westerdykella ornata]KAF2276532.1 hypothetical protein EI97DRAFT_433363 [Westerdykella ornata]